MSERTYGYINKVNNKWLDLLGLDLIESDELIVLGHEDDIKEYQEREVKNEWTEYI